MPSQLKILIFFFAFNVVANAQHIDNPQVVRPHVSPSLRFTENLGQWDDPILFRSTFFGGALFVEKEALTFHFFDEKKLTAIHRGGIVNGEVKDLNIKNHVYKIHFDGANPNPRVEKQQEGLDYENFYLGNDQKRWKSNVRNFHQVFLRDMYPGIDYEIITAIKGMKYNFHVKTGSDASLIKMRYEGVDHMQIKNGALILKLNVNGVTEQRPYAYQIINGDIVNVPCKYVLKNKILSFEFPQGFDQHYDLVIDPVLVFAAQSGSNANNFGMTATFDSQGNLYAGGTAFSNGYPTSIGAFNSSFSGTPGNGITDVVITKYNASGNALLFSTYIGGSEAEIVSSLIVDHSDNLCFYGATGSLNFPMLSNSFDPSFNGGSFLSFFFNGTTFNNGTDIYLAKFNTTGTSLLASTYLGGSGNDGVNHVNHFSLIQIASNVFVNEFGTDSLQYNYGDQYRGEIQVDPANNIYIASSTRSGNFPTANAFDASLGGLQDAVVCKLNSSLSQLLYSTYLGGSSNECGNALIVNDNLEVYVTGGTCSQDFPATSGAFNQTYSGGKADGYIARIGSTGNILMQATLLGTSLYDQSYFIQADKYQNIYVYGQSMGNMPVVVASNATSIYSNPGRHQFITRFNNTLSNVNMATVFGSKTTTMDVSPCAFSVDKCNNLYLSGWGGDIIMGTNALSNMPLFQPTQNTTTGFDFYFFGLDSNAQAIKYGSYFGGAFSAEHVDGGTSRFDPGGRIYQSACAGCQNNDDWPVTPGAWPLTPGNSNHSNGCNNGVVKLDFQLQTAIATIQTNTMAGCVPFVATFTSATPPTGSGSTFVWYLAPGITTSTNPNPTVTYTAPGIYTVSLVIKDNLTCNKKDSAVTYITVYPSPTANILVNNNGCSRVVTVSNTSTGNLGNNPHAWDFGPSTSTLSALSFTYPANGTFNITYTVTDNNGCKDVATKTVNVFQFTPGALSTASLCAGKTATLNASGGTNYSWTPTTGLNNANSATPIVSPLVTTTYSVIILNNSAGYNCIDTLTTQVLVLPNPSNNFTLSSSPCSNTISTGNFSSGNFGSSPFIWDFGDGSPTQTSPSPIYTYPGNGTYTVTLLVTDVLGCQTAISKTVAIFNFTPGVVSSASICYGNTTTLVAEGGTTYTWTPPASLSSTATGITAANPTTTTIYTVQIENDTPGYTCARTLTTEILVRPTPTANFNFSLNPCGGGVHFLDQSADDISTWSWTMSPIRTSTVQNPYNFYSEGGHFTVTLVATNIYGCPNIVAQELDVLKPPLLSVASGTNICIGSSTQLDADGGVAYDWTPPETLDFPGLHNPVATPSVTTEYSVNITTNQSVGGNVCKFILTVSVQVDVLSNTPISAFANPVIVTVGEPSTLVYIGQPGALVTWLPSGSTTPQTGYTVVTYPERPTTYTAVANRGACTEDVEVHVDAFTAGCATKDFFVPNTFTPNGDGHNDVLYVRSLKTSELYFAVYNRWGEMVFETSDPNTGWDGKYKGRDADVGVFGWYFKAKCANGGETFQKGNVTLIR